MKSPFLRRTSLVTLVAFSLASFTPVVQAGVIGTEQALASGSMELARDRIATTLARADVQAQLAARGVDPAVVAARVASLSDAEVAEMDARIDQMPAGGDGILGTLVFIFIVLLITDLLGWTSVFPFTNKGSVGN
jgi:hypothetical protein